MKHQLIRLSHRYVAALRTHLKVGRRAAASDGMALTLGREAVALGLDTLDLARIHVHALVRLELARGQSVLIKRAELFFAATLTPIEETHRAAKQSKIQLLRLNQTLSRRTEQLAASELQLKRGGIRRQLLEDICENGDKRHDTSLEESLQLQKRLRQLTHKVLAAQENERHKISHELQDEIAQTLLGINVRLLSLQQDAQGNLKGLQHEISSTQRLVAKSARSVRKFARELGGRHPA
jgi:signal transduction histidine kinase